MSKSKNRFPKCQKEGTELSKWHPMKKNSKYQDVSLTIQSIACRNGHQLHKTKKRTDQEPKSVDNTKHCFISKKIRLKAAGPSLEGHQGCGDIVQCLFFSIAVIAIQLSACAWMSLEVPKTRRPASPDPECWIWDFVKNRFVFKLVFKA